MPDAVRLFAVENRRVEIRFGNIARTILFDKRQPSFAEIEINFSVGGGKTFSAVKTHRKIFGNRIELEILLNNAGRKFD